MELEIDKKYLLAKGISHAHLNSFGRTTDMYYRDTYCITVISIEKYVVINDFFSKLHFKEYHNGTVVGDGDKTILFCEDKFFETLPDELKLDRFSFDGKQSSRCYPHSHMKSMIFEGNQYIFDTLDYIDVVHVKHSEIITSLNNLFQKMCNEIKIPSTDHNTYKEEVDNFINSQPQNTIIHEQ